MCGCVISNAIGTRFLSYSVSVAMSVEVEEKGGLAGGFVDVRVCCRSGRYSKVFLIVFIISAIDAPRHNLIVCRLFEAASRSTVLVSMTALQQQQATVVLPLTLPLSDPPLCVEIAHSSANANLLVHSVDVAGSEGLWEGDLHIVRHVQFSCSLPYASLQANSENKGVEEGLAGVCGRLSCLERLSVPLLHKKA